MRNIRNHLIALIKRPTPYAILSWRYLSHKQSPSVYLHKLAFLHAWPNLPRIGWGIIALYSYGMWFAFYGWAHLWKTWHRFNQTLLELAGISRTKQLCDLWRLAFMQTTPPIDYYHYRLYRYPTTEWMDFIYTHELPSWHRAMSPNMSQRTINLLSDKAAFAQEMRKQGLPVIDSIVIPQGSNVSREHLFQQSSLFLKPLCGSRKIDSYGLEYHSSSDTYTVVVSADQVMDTREDIMDFFNALIKKQDYIIQPMLRNHKALQIFFSFEVLITIRLITVWTGSKAQAVSALIELPINTYSNRVYAMPVDIEQGIILPIEETVFSVLNDKASEIKHLAEKKIILWPELVDVAQKAHAFFSDLFSIGWDLAITPDGIRLIEGNINWGVAQHQINNPLLMPSYIQHMKL
jgi:hypothetical protein